MAGGGAGQPVLGLKGKQAPADSPLRDIENMPLAEIDADLKRSTDRILDMIRGLSA